MKTQILGFLTSAGLCAALLPVSAGAAERRPINQRQHTEQARIRQGIRSGELTRREAVRLESQQARIRTQERFARRDGTLTPAERQRLQRELNSASRNVYRQKHDNQDRN